MLYRPRPAAILLVMLLCGSCGEPLEETPRPGAVAEGGPVLARVGKQQLRLGQLPGLAAVAEELHGELGLPSAPVAGTAQRLELAIEVLALAEVAARRGAERKEWFAEQQRRLLARVYLKKLVDQLDAQPLDSEQVRRLYQHERQKLLHGEISDIFSPSRVDAMAVVVGYFPDLHEPGDREQPLLDPQQARQLAGRIRERALPVAHDTDAFLAIVRRFMKDNPTVQVKEFWKTIVADDLTRMSPPLHRHLVELPGPGSLSQPFVVPGGVVIMRRGITVPGKGESLEQVKERLEEMLRRQRRAKLVERHLGELRHKLDVEVYPGRLRGGEGVGP